ncbi:MAG: S8 family serine peptidase [Rubripirellula sp.]
MLRHSDPTSNSPRRSPSGHRFENRARFRLLSLQTLEDRRCLAASIAPELDLSQLTVDPNSYDPSSILVRYHTEQAPAIDATNLYGPSLTLEGVPIGFGLHQVELHDGASLQSVLDSYRADPDVDYAEPDYHVRMTAVPNDPMFDQQWDMHNLGQTSGTIDADIDAPEAWDVSTGNGSTIVAVIDTGVDYRHPDLAPNIWTNPGEIPGDGIDNDNNGYVDDIHGYDFFNEDGDPLDDHNHGTHVAGTIAAEGNDGIGIAGVNWGAQIMAIKFLGADGSGTTSDAIEAVRYAVDNGAQISNNSWGGDPYSQAMYDVIRDARDVGHIFVAASGNGDFIGFGIDNDATPFYPASYDLDNIVAVGATDHNDRMAIFSNYGANSVDLAAPGVDILSTTINGGYGNSSGTSMATPHVAGALSLVRDADPALSYSEIISQVLFSADPIDSLQGVTVTGARLNLAASLIPDETGPKIEDVEPSGLVLDPFNSIQIRFSETLETGSFTLDDIAQFIGPDGIIPLTALTPVAGSNHRVFELSFESQTVAGTYELTVSPGVTDRFGNVMDQNENGVGGETDDALVHDFLKVDAVARFDFGTTLSPVATNYTRVTGGDAYNTTVGHGWVSGPVYSLERGGEALTADFNYTRDANFGVDLPNGEYDVIVTLGESIVGHDQMGVFLEGVQAGSVSTSAGEFAVNTYRTSVSDGQLNLGLRDLGGTDPWVMINGVDIVFAGPDLTGPSIIATDAVGDVAGPLERVHVTFSEPIAPTSFSLDDILSFQGPDGAIPVNAVNAIAPGEFEITFDTLNITGDFELVLGPDITDVAGNTLDQDGDGLSGEPIDDRFRTSFSMEKGPEFLAGYDFGTFLSPVADGYIGVTGGDKYNETAGHGWLEGAVYSLSRGGDPLTLDVNYTTGATFAVDLPNGEYDITVTLGEVLIPHDQMGVFVEGVLVDNVSTAGSQFAVNTYRTSISDGQLTLGLDDLGGSDPWVMINALDVLFVGPDLTGPQVTGTDVLGTVTGPVDRIVVSFSEPIDPGSLTLDDIVALEGPAGAITPTGITQVAAGEFAVEFAAQNDSGSYRLVLGSDITDIAGNLVDQDLDGVTGEVTEDQFELLFAIEAGPVFIAHFDFGTTLSPVADGYTRVITGDRYSESNGYGWSAGAVYSLNRSGPPLTTDLNYTSDATFAFDLENGEYEVTLIMGEVLIGHDQMAVSLEDVRVDVVSIPGFQFATNTYQTEVTDGQLNIRLQDLGGSNPYAVINALDIARVVQPATAGIAAIDQAIIESTADDTDTLPLDPPPATELTTSDPIVDTSAPASTDQAVVELVEEEPEPAPVNDFLALLRLLSGG